jgi:hypothetical protein
MNYKMFHVEHFVNLAGHTMETDEEIRRLACWRIRRHAGVCPRDKTKGLEDQLQGQLNLAS